VRLLRDNPLRTLRLGKALAKTDQFYPRELIDAHIVRMIGTVRPAHYDYRVTGSYELGFGPLTLKSKIQHNKKRPQARLRWKLYLKLFRIRIFALSLPLKA